MCAASQNNGLKNNSYAKEASLGTELSGLYTTGTPRASLCDAENAEFSLRGRAVGQIAPEADADPALKHGLGTLG